MSIWFLPIFFVIACTTDAAFHFDGEHDSIKFSGSIFSSVTKKCVDIHLGVQNDDLKAQQWDCWGGPNQKFDFTKDAESGLYEIKVMSSGKCLSVKSDNDQDGSGVVQYSCASNKVSKLWEVVGTGSTRRIKSSTNSSLCLQFDGETSKNGALLVQKTCSEQDIEINDKWSDKKKKEKSEKIKQLKRDMWRIDAALDFEDDDKDRGMPGSIEFFYEYEYDISLCLNPADAAKPSNSEGAAIIRTACNPRKSSSEDQDFQFIYCEDSELFKIKSIKTNKCLCPKDRSVDDEMPIVQVDCNEVNDSSDDDIDEALLWNVTGSFSRRLSIVNKFSQRCLYVDAFGTSEKLGQTSCDGEFARHWKINAQLPNSPPWRDLSSWTKPRQPTPRPTMVRTAAPLYFAPRSSPTQKAWIWEIYDREYAKWTGEGTDENN
uniref:Ricin B lectin domain-containing protein n=1 Tax=Grammatophora oceanica TaxID=210454 RepID=A0A7S1YKH1_9STRA